MATPLELARAMIGIGVETGEVSRGMDQVKKIVMGSLGNLARSVGATVSLGLGVKLAGDAELARVKLNLLIRDLQKTDKLISQLGKLSRTSIFSEDQYIAASRALIEVGVSVERVVPLVKTLGIVAAGGGKDVDTLASAYARMLKAGSVNQRTLRYFAAAGLDLKLLAKSAGIAGKAFDDMVKKGISISTVNDWINKAVREGGRFHDAMEELADTFVNLKKKVAEAFGDISKALGKVLLPYAKRILDILRDIANAVIVFDEALGGLPSKLMAFALTLKTFSAAKAMLGKFGFSVKGLIGSFLSLKNIGMLLKGGVFAVVLLVVEKIGKAISALKPVQEAWARATEKLGYAWDNIKRGFQSIWDTVKGFFGFVGTGTTNIIGDLGNMVASTLGYVSEFVADASEWFLVLTTHLDLFGKKAREIWEFLKGEKGMSEAFDISSMVAELKRAKEKLEADRQKRIDELKKKAQEGIDEGGANEPDQATKDKTGKNLSGIYSPQELWKKLQERALDKTEKEKDRVAMAAAVKQGAKEGVREGMPKPAGGGGVPAPGGAPAVPGAPAGAPPEPLPTTKREIDEFTKAHGQAGRYKYRQSRRNNRWRDRDFQKEVDSLSRLERRRRKDYGDVRERNMAKGTVPTIDEGGVPGVLTDAESATLAEAQRRIELQKEAKKADMTAAIDRRRASRAAEAGTRRDEIKQQQEKSHKELVEAQGPFSTRRGIIQEGHRAGRAETAQRMLRRKMAEAGMTGLLAAAPVLGGGEPIPSVLPTPPAAQSQFRVGDGELTRGAYSPRSHIDDRAIKGGTPYPTAYPANWTPPMSPPIAGFFGGMPGTDSIGSRYGAYGEGVKTAPNVVRGAEAMAPILAPLEGLLNKARTEGINRDRRARPMLETTPENKARLRSINADMTGGGMASAPPVLKDTLVETKTQTEILEKILDKIGSTQLVSA